MAVTLDKKALAPVISAEIRAGQYAHDDIEDALKQLLEQIDG
jgi:hypothetical protein